MRVDVIFSPDLSPGEITELGLLAERLAIGAVWASNYPSTRDPFIALCPLAAASSTIRLGPLVITPYELHPLKISKALLGLNELAGGRANVLIGGPTGLNAAMGLKTTRMVGMVRETVEILKATSAERTLNYPGRIFQVWGYKPAWATAPPPQIYVGANKSQMVAMATRLADNIMIGDVTPEHLATAVRRIDEGLAAAGRRRTDIRLSGLVAWHVRADAGASMAEARQQLALRAMLDTAYLAPFLSAEECQVVDLHRESFFRAYKNGTNVIDSVPDSIIEKLVANLTCSGTPADIGRHIERLQRFAAMGLTEVALKLHGDCANHAAAIRLIGKRVVPALR